ncbi:glycosyltransferase family 4 protein [Plantactinospora sp. CA-290183]|uniref:glycosyltransferase family 4 protein n=1 Tax=Plantactinospora sp. CA-290183 TaxID=3240006 RepID=UPI003D8D2EE4
MLVHNAVKGDSRVQKTARSAADAGWDVILLGRSKDRQAHTWQEGAAEVRLIPMSSPLTKRPHDFRRRWLRGPLAYPPTGVAAYRHQSVKAWRADLRVRQSLLVLAARSGRPPAALPLRRAALRAQQVLAKLVAGWVGLRYRQLNRAQEARRRLTGPWDRAQAFVWQKVMGDRAWRKLEPRLWDFELAFGPVIDKLKPDLIHAHDFRMVGVAARAAIRGRAAGRDVKLVWDVHEFLPGINPGGNTAQWLPGLRAAEREYGRYADAVITVSESLGDLLVQEHGLKQRPYVVLNAPHGTHTPDDDELDLPVPDIRAICGIGPDVPLLVYSGGAAVQRGLDTMVEALPQLDDVHVGFVVPSATDPYVQQLLARAAELGVADRVHLLPYVRFWQVVPFLSGADVGVIPIHHWPNHEIALITKFFEYSHARLPIVVSDVRTMAETVRRTGQGEVFRAEDVTDYVRAVRAVLADPKRYRAAYDEPGLLERWTWEAQAEVLDEVYTRLLPGRPGPQTG